MKRGKLIVIEGGEGSGKGEHVRRLTEFFKERNIPVENYREPGEGNLGEEIRRIVKHSDWGIDSLTEVFLFEAARSNLYRTKIIPCLNEGKNVVTDRSGLSTLVYQGYAGGVDMNFIEEANYHSTRGIEPDVTFVIDVPVEMGLANEVVKDNNFTKKGREYHEKINEGYRILTGKNRVLIPYLHGKIDEMQEQMREEIRVRFGKEWNHH
jgi:dTMP kinase